MDGRNRSVVSAVLVTTLVVLGAFVAVVVGRDGGRGGQVFDPLLPDGAILRTLADKRDIYIGVGANQRRLTGQRYVDGVSRHFNSITPQSGWKWEIVQPGPGRYDFTVPDLVVDIAQRNDMRVRAHTLIWHHQNPEWLETGDWSREQLLRIMKDHITTVMSRYRGEVEQWDVVNEVVDPMTNQFRDSFWERIIGPEYIELAFRWAHEADPDAELYYNDFGIDRPGPHFRLVHDMIKRLKDDGVPIHGVGLQMHRNLRSPSVGQLKYVMDEFTALDIDVELTELDIRLPLPTNDESIRDQAQAFASTTGVCLAVARCTGVTVWGYDDNDRYPGLERGREGSHTLISTQGAPKEAYAGVALALARVPGASNRPPPPSPSLTPG